MKQLALLILASLPFCGSVALAKNTFSSNPVWGNDTYGHLKTGDIVYQDEEIICFHGKSNKCYDKEVVKECGMPPEEIAAKIKYQECKKAIEDKHN